MKYTKEFSIDDFNFWGYAERVVRIFRNNNMYDELEMLIEEAFTDSVPSATEINDFVSFIIPEEYPYLFE